MVVSRVQNFLTNIADAGRELLERRRYDDDAVKDLRTLCSDVLSQRGEALGTALARELVRGYQALDDDGKLAFFRMLRDEFEADFEAINGAVEAYQAAPGPATVLTLSQATETPRRKLLRAINMAPDGTAAVLAMRRDLLALMLADESGLGAVDGDFIQPLSSWFQSRLFALGANRLANAGPRIGKADSLRIGS